MSCEEVVYTSFIFRYENCVNLRFYFYTDSFRDLVYKTLSLAVIGRKKEFVERICTSEDIQGYYEEFMENVLYLLALFFRNSLRGSHLLQAGLYH